MKKLLYMMIGGVLALVLVFGAFSAFAQAENTEDVESGETITTPGWYLGRGGGRFGQDGPLAVASDELLAEALGISVEALQSAHEEARTAAIEQAVADGLITQEQADQLLSGATGFAGGFRMGRFGFSSSSIDYNALLAEALGISVEELETAREEAHTARLAEMVEAGTITQEQADMMLAYQAVRGYVDYDSINEILQSAHQDAINQALADGVITQDQADQMLDSISSMGGFGVRGFGGHRGGFGGFGKAFRQAPAVTDTTGV